MLQLQLRNKVTISAVIILSLFVYPVEAGNLGSMDFESSSSQSLSTPDTANLSITGNITLMGWVRHESFPPGAGERVYFGKGQTDSAFCDVCITMIEDAGSLILRGVFTNNVNSAVAFGAGTWTGVVVDRWYHIACRFDTAGNPGSGKCYINGTENASEDVAANTLDDSASAFYIGQEGDGTKFFDGKIDDVRVYARLLTPTEIQRIMRREEVAEDARGYWKLNSLRDSSTYGHHLTNTNGAIFDTDRGFAGSQIVIPMED